MRARRVELRRRRAELAAVGGPVGGPGSALRAELAALRATVVAAAAEESAQLRQEAVRAVEEADRTGRAALPGLVADAVAAIEERSREHWARAARSAARRAVAACGLLVEPGALVPPGPPATTGHDPPPRVRATEVLTDATGWRLALLPVVSLSVVLPLLGRSPAASGLFLPAAGLGLVVLVAVARTRHAALHRARLLAHTDALTGGVRDRVAAELARRLLGCEDVVARHVERRLDAERTAVAAELATISPEGADADP